MLEEKLTLSYMDSQEKEIIQCVLFGNFICIDMVIQTSVLMTDFSKTFLPS